MAVASKGLNDNYALGFDHRFKAKKPKMNPHTNGYDDDGLVITMTLRKFFGACADYASYLDGGHRAYISLTDESGQEVFQFSLLSSFNAPRGADIEYAVVMSGKRAINNIRTAFGYIGNNQDPLTLESQRGHVYGVLYPAVMLDRG